MGVQQFLYVAAVVLLVIAALSSWSWRPDWPGASYGHTAGWAGLACYVAAGLM